MQLEGFDVVTFSAHTNPECSPLSCCALAKDLAVNEHCLFRTFADAKEAIDRGLFTNSEPGPYRIFSVYASPAANPSFSRTPCQPRWQIPSALRAPAAGYLKR
jgi:hypothetical protein